MSIRRPAIFMRWTMTQRTRSLSSLPRPGATTAPHRKIHTPHGAFGIAVDDEHQEMMVSVEHDNAVVAYKKNAGTDDAPIRLIQGDKTLLADPHGMAFDTKDDLLFVANHGSTASVRPPGEAKNYGTRVHGTYGNKQELASYAR